jgi:hypothetical protein
MSNGIFVRRYMLYLPIQYCTAYTALQRPFPTLTMGTSPRVRVNFKNDRFSMTFHITSVSRHRQKPTPPSPSFARIYLLPVLRAPSVTFTRLISFQWVVSNVATMAPDFVLNAS